jgi:hypothetical protein
MDAAGARALKERIEAHQAAKAARSDAKAGRPSLGVAPPAQQPRPDDAPSDRPKS